MFGKNKKRVAQIDSIIGQGTEITGDVRFTGGLHVDGAIKGNVTSTTESDAILTLSAQGSIQGQVHVPEAILNGTIEGDVYVSEHIELASNARIIGNVYYNLIEMAMGAEVNGSLIHKNDSHFQAKPKPSVVNETS